MAKKTAGLQRLVRATVILGLAVAAPAFADVAVGDRIGPDNVDKAKDLLSPGMEWCVKRGFPITVGETKHVEWPQAYKDEIGRAHV